MFKASSRYYKFIYTLSLTWKGEPLNPENHFNHTVPSSKPGLRVSYNLSRTVAAIEDAAFPSASPESYCVRVTESLLSTWPVIPVSQQKLQKSMCHTSLPWKAVLRIYQSPATTTDTIHVTCTFLLCPLHLSQPQGEKEAWVSGPSLGPACLTAINEYLSSIPNEHLTLCQVVAPTLQAFAVGIPSSWKVLLSNPHMTSFILSCKILTKVFNVTTPKTSSFWTWGHSRRRRGWDELRE